MRHRGSSRLRSRLPRLSLPLSPPEFGTRFRPYVNQGLALQVMLAVGILLILAGAVSTGVAALTGQSNQKAATGPRTPSASPADMPVIALEHPTPSPASSQIPLQQYVTHDGETIDGVANATGRSTETLLWANTISEPDKPLPAGVQLNVPPVDGLLYLVQPGDTLARIAEAVEAQPGNITGYAPNHVAQDSDLVPGQLILVPGASIKNRERVVTYDVRRGDTVGAIAGRFGLQPGAILLANDVSDPNLIYEGQALIIPPSSGMVTQVQAGDTLDSLASRWGVDAASIADYPGNNITDPDTLIAGQSVIIPTSKASSTPTAAGPGTAKSASADATPAPPPSTGGSESGVPATSEHGPEDPAPTAPSPEPAQSPANAATSPSPAHPTDAAPSPPQPSPSDGTSASSSPSSPPASPRGNFIWPAKGKITQHFGPTDVKIEPPYEGYPHFHTGLDIANDEGTPVVAADEGTVAFAGWSTNGLGYTVTINHDNGFVTSYGHLAEQPSVTSGERVSKGQEIGLMGSTGNSEGPHLHFMVVLNDSYQNPSDFLP